MITLGEVGKISPIFLTVLLIGYLILVELGHEKIKKALIPLVIVLIAVFLIIAVVDIISKL
jgi:O-antigen ligase